MATRGARRADALHHDAAPPHVTLPTGVPRRTSNCSAEAERQGLRAADEAVLLRAALGRDQRLDPARGRDVEQHVQERDVLGLGRPHAPRRRPPSARGRGACAGCGASTCRNVCRPSASARRASHGARGRHLARHPVEAERGLREVGERVRRELRDAARVAPHARRRTRPGARRRRRSGSVATPSSAASAASRSCVGPIHCPPASTTLPSPISWLSVRPPTRSRASSTTTRLPARVRSRAATRPASPAPTTITSTSSTTAYHRALCHSTSPTTASASSEDPRAGRSSRSSSRPGWRSSRSARRPRRSRSPRRPTDPAPRVPQERRRPLRPY